jgi:hypothetical protein
MRIKIFSSFCTSDQAKESYEKVCRVHLNDNYGINKDIYIVGENETNYSHAIILNTAMPMLNIPKKNVIGFALEPISFLGVTQQFIEYVKKNISKYFIGTKLDNMPNEFIETFSYMTYSCPIEPIIKKTRIMSIALSKKKFAPGHMYRHILVNRIVQEKLPIYIYGRGANEYKSPYNMGVFDDLEPYETYMYSICIENYRTPQYFSEKILNPIMCNCMPIYYGCENISQYLDKDLLHIINGSIDEDINLIKKILSNPMKYYKEPYSDMFEEKINMIKNVKNLYE